MMAPQNVILLLLIKPRDLKQGFIKGICNLGILIEALRSSYFAS